MSGIWTKLTVKAKTELLDTVCAVMSMLDNGLMIEDYSDFSLNGMYGELVDDSILNADTEFARVSLFVPEEKNPLEYKAYLEERFASLSIDAEMSLEGLSEDDWAEAWKQYYKPISIENVTIVPAWEKYSARKDEVTVRMDPGMAFGTGTHETTRLIIKLMQDINLKGARVLDVGTGSGILSICASLLGADFCAAYDIDPVAVRVARENVRDNNIENVSVDVSDLLHNVDLSGGKFSVCFANIVSDIIIRMLPDVKKYISEGSPLILSGIIDTRKDEVCAAVRKYGFSIIKEEKENDWVALLCV